jgi:hypothetical protein
MNPTLVLRLATETRHPSTDPSPSQPSAPPPAAMSAQPQLPKQLFPIPTQPMAAEPAPADNPENGRRFTRPLASVATDFAVGGAAAVVAKTGPRRWSVSSCCCYKTKASCCATATSRAPTRASPTPSPASSSRRALSHSGVATRPMSVKSRIS